MLAKWILCSFLFFQSFNVFAQDLCTKNEKSCSLSELDVDQIQLLKEIAELEKLIERLDPCTHNKELCSTLKSESETLTKEERLAKAKELRASNDALIERMSRFQEWIYIFEKELLFFLAYGVLLAVVD